jgi:hypothetical protein
MPHPVRFIPAFAALLILGLMLVGSSDPHDNLCRVARMPVTLSQQCLALKNLPLFAGATGGALIALTLLLLLRWQRSRHRAISYESDAGRWVVLGWILALGGALALLAGMLLIGSNGWPFSQQSRHITIRTGQLPVFISTVQRRYFANYFGPDGGQSLCAGFGAVTIRNRSNTRSLALDLGLTITPRESGRHAPESQMRAGRSVQRKYRRARLQSLRRNRTFRQQIRQFAILPASRSR